MTPHQIKVATAVSQIGKSISDLRRDFDHDTDPMFRARALDTLNGYTDELIDFLADHGHGRKPQPNSEPKGAVASGV